MLVVGTGGGCFDYFSPIFINKFTTIKTFQIQVVT